MDPGGKSFIQTYLDYTSENEAPELFHFWSAVACIGHVVNRKVWLDQFYFKLYPGQIMVALVSDSAVSRKTTAINIAVDLLAALPDEDINIVTGQLSPRSMLEALDRRDADGEQKDAIGFIVADELGNFLRKESFAEALATDLCALNTTTDRPFQRTMASFSICLPNPCVGGLFGTTPTGLAKEIPATAQTAGLLGRIIPIYQDETDRVNDLLDAPANMYKQKVYLMKELFRISALSGGFVFSADGKDFYRKWYKQYKRMGAGVDEQTGFYGRKAGHMLRVAMVLAVMRGSKLVLDERVLKAAVRAVDQVQSWIPQAYRKLGAHYTIEHADRILSRIERAGGRLVHSVLAGYMSKWLPGKHLAESIESLVASGQVVRIVEKTPTKPRTVYELPSQKGKWLGKGQENPLVEDEEDED